MTDRQTEWRKATCSLYNRSATFCHKVWQLALSRTVVAYHIITSVCALCCTDLSTCSPLFLCVGSFSDTSFSSVRPRISPTHFLLHNVLSVIVRLKKCIFEVFTVLRCCTAYGGSYRLVGSTGGSQIQGSGCPRKSSWTGGSIIRIQRTVIGWQGK